MLRRGKGGGGKDGEEMDEGRNGGEDREVVEGGVEGGGWRGDGREDEGEKESRKENNEMDEKVSKDEGREREREGEERRALLEGYTTWLK